MERTKFLLLSYHGSLDKLRRCKPLGLRDFTLTNNNVYDMLCYKDSYLFFFSTRGQKGREHFPFWLKVLYNICVEAQATEG